MKLLKIFRKQSKTTNVAVKYWTFKKIPLEDWQACQEGEIWRVRKDVSEDVKEYTPEDLRVWETIQDMYIEEFHDDKKKIRENLRLRLRIANLKIKFMQDSKKNRILINDINQLEEELRKQRASDTDNGMTLEQCKVILSKYQGYHLPETITAYSFFTLIKTINEQK